MVTGEDLLREAVIDMIGAVIISEKQLDDVLGTIPKELVHPSGWEILLGLREALASTAIVAGNGRVRDYELCLRSQEPTLVAHALSHMRFVAEDDDLAMLLQTVDEMSSSFYEHPAYLLSGMSFDAFSRLVQEMRKTCEPRLRERAKCSDTRVVIEDADPDRR